MTSPKYPNWDIVEVTAGKRRTWIMVKEGLDRWIQVVQWGRQFFAQVYADAKLIRGGMSVLKAIETAEF